MQHLLFLLLRTRMLGGEEYHGRAKYGSLSLPSPVPSCHPSHPPLYVCHSRHCQYREGGNWHVSSCRGVQTRASERLPRFVLRPTTCPVFSRVALGTHVAGSNRPLRIFCSSCNIVLRGLSPEQRFIDFILLMWMFPRQTVIYTMKP